MREEIDCSYLKSLLERIVKKLPPDSELYGLAVLVEAYKDVTKFKPQEIRDRLKRFTAYRTRDIKKCAYNEITSNLMKLQRPPYTVLLDKMKQLHYAKENDPPHLRVIFAILFSEAMTTIVKDYAKSIYDGISLGERIINIVTRCEVEGTDEVLNFLKEYETKNPPLDALPSLLNEVFKKYSVDSLEERFSELHKVFNDFQENKVLDEIVSQNLEPEFKVQYGEKCLGYLFPFTEMESIFVRRRTPHYVLGRYFPTSKEMTCCIWTLFLEQLWKIVLIHEAVEAFFYSQNVGRYVISTKNKKVSSFEENGLNQMWHALKHNLTLKVARRYPELDNTINLVFGTIPLGQVLCLSWYQSLGKRYPKMLLEMPFSSYDQGMNTLARDCVCEVLNKTLERIGEAPCFSRMDSPNPCIFMSGDMLRNEIIKGNPDVNTAAISRCITLLLTTTPLGKNQIIDNIQGKYPDSVEYSTKDGWEKAAIEKVINELTNLSILTIQDGEYKLEL